MADKADKKPDYVIYRIQRDWSALREEIETNAGNGAGYPSAVVLEPGHGHNNDPGFIAWAHGHHIQVIAYQNAQTQDIAADELPTKVPYAFLNLDGKPIEDKNWPGEYSGDMLASDWLRDRLFDRVKDKPLMGEQWLNDHESAPLHEMLDIKAKSRRSYAIARKELKEMLDNPEFRAQAVQQSALAQHLIAQGKARIDTGFDGTNYDNFGRWLDLDANKQQVNAYKEKYGGLPEKDVVTLLRHVDEQLDAYKKSAGKGGDFVLFAQNGEELFDRYPEALMRTLPDGTKRPVAGMTKEDLWFTGDGAEGGREADKAQGNSTVTDIALVKKALERGFPVISSEYATTPENQEIALEKARSLAAAGRFGVSFGTEDQATAVPVHHPKLYGKGELRGAFLSPASAGQQPVKTAAVTPPAASAPSVLSIDQSQAATQLAVAISYHLDKHKDPMKTLNFMAGRGSSTLGVGKVEFEKHPDIVRAAMGKLTPEQQQAFGTQLGEAAKSSDSKLAALAQQMQQGITTIAAAPATPPVATLVSSQPPSQDVASASLQQQALNRWFSDHTDMCSAVKTPDALIRSLAEKGGTTLEDGQKIDVANPQHQAMMAQAVASLNPLQQQQLEHAARRTFETQASPELQGIARQMLDTVSAAHRQSTPPAPAEVASAALAQTAPAPATSAPAAPARAEEPASRGREIAEHLAARMQAQAQARAQQRAAREVPAAQPAAAAPAPVVTPAAPPEVAAPVTTPTPAPASASAPPPAKKPGTSSDEVPPAATPTAPQIEAQIQAVKAFAAEIAEIGEAVGKLNNRNIADDGQNLRKLQQKLRDMTGQPASPSSFKDGDYLKREPSQALQQSLQKTVADIMPTLDQATTPAQIDALRRKVAESIQPHLAPEHVVSAPDRAMQQARQDLQRDLGAIRKAVKGLNNHRTYDDAGHMQTLDGFVKAAHGDDKGTAHGLHEAPERGDYLLRKASQSLHRAVDEVSKEVGDLIRRDDATREQIEAVREKMAKAIEDNMRDEEVKRREDTQKQSKSRQR